MEYTINAEKLKMQQRAIELLSALGLNTDDIVYEEGVYGAVTFKITLRRGKFIHLGSWHGNIDQLEKLCKLLEQVK